MSRVEMPEGMKAWAGNPGPPIDYAGGPVYTREGRVLDGSALDGAAPDAWLHAGDPRLTPYIQARQAARNARGDLTREDAWPGADIVAYTPIATPEPVLPHPEVDAMAKGEAMRRAILDIEMTPVTPPYNAFDEGWDAAVKAYRKAIRALAQPITEQPSPVGEVTQADREAASRYYGYDDEAALRYWGNVSQHRDVERLARAFADRRSATPPSDDAARIKVLEEARSDLLKLMDDLQSRLVSANAQYGAFEMIEVVRRWIDEAALGGRHDR